MNQLYMLDTNTVSYIIKGKSPAARATLAGLKAHQIASISVITEGELWYGIAKMPTGDLLRRALDAFLTKIRILPWDRNEASAYGQLRAKHERTGKLLGNLDMLIAAHAIAAGAILVTNNKAFAQVQDLEGIVNWATDLENAQL